MAYFAVRQEAPSTLPGGNCLFVLNRSSIPFSFKNSLLVILRISLWRLKRFGEFNNLRGSPWLSCSLSPCLVLPENREREQRPGHFHRDSNCSFPVWTRKWKLPNAELGGDHGSNQVRNKWQRPLFDLPPNWVGIALSTAMSGSPKLVSVAGKDWKPGTKGQSECGIGSPPFLAMD